LKRGEAFFQVSPDLLVKKMKCPICGDAAEKEFLCKAALIMGAEHDVVECASCSAIYFEPMPTLAELEQFYSASYYDFERHRNEGRGMAFAKKYLRDLKPGKFLDVGCANGFFINGIRQNTDWEVYGVDFGSAAVRFAREELKLNVFPGDLTETDFADAYFDFVHINNVLEHVLDPLAVLKECRRIIKSDGTMYLSVPNGLVDSRDLIRYYKTENRTPRSKNGHIFFLQAETVRRVLAEAGFKIIRSHTYGIRRGMRSLGWLPQKGNWKAPYVLKEKSAASDTFTVNEKKKKPDFYYQYRFAQLNAKMLPGLHKFGLDYQLFLKPI
jgi:2-polyprenyl-3-methyl-5-hydroxy-6-metoxy-1,4-benzoquinol methylase